MESKVRPRGDLGWTDCMQDGEGAIVHGKATTYAGVKKIADSVRATEVLNGAK